MNQLFGLQHRGDRLGHSSRHTQVPVPVTILLPKDLEVKEKLPIFAGDTMKHPLQGLQFITIKTF